MGKINQIQNKLSELNGGAFQKLSDSYLLKKGYPQINPIGSVVGSNKVRKGTPDTLVPLPNGKYVFAEYTTQKTEVFGKFKDDLKNCFDEQKTGIPLDKIQEIVFCHTTDLLPAELNFLRTECEKYRVNLNVFGIGAISYDLLEKFPGIAKDYLGVEVDTGQIVLVDEFINLCDKHKLATRLTTSFHFREEEIAQIDKALEENDLIIITGEPGVGKSRFALECCKKFKQKHSSYKVQCIFNRYVDLFQDICVHFSEPGDFLILVDDANRISGFTYIIQRLQDKRDYQRIKVISTVRDYALEKIREIILPYGNGFEIKLSPLSEKQIMQLAEEEYGIKNYRYLERIADISHGNPRIAIMASEVAKEKDTLDSIRDVSELYDKYYESIRKDLLELKNQNILKTAGIAAFFRNIDRSGKKLMKDIEEVFAITNDDFWQAAQELHRMELFDIYENEVVKISNQVLSTYIFYLVFFKEKILDFGLLVTHFFPRFRQSLVEAINPVLNSFNAQAIMETMRPAVDHAWNFLRKEGSEYDFRQLIEVFWYLNETNTLNYVKEQIEKMEPKATEIANIKFEADSSTNSTPLLNILRVFRYSSVENFSIALNLFFEYLTKRTENVPQVLYYLIDEFGFDRDSYSSGFILGKMIIEEMWKRASKGEDSLFSKLFIAVAEKYLHTHFSKVKPGKRDTVNLIDFDLPATPHLLELRKAIWKKLHLLLTLVLNFSQV